MTVLRHALFGDDFHQTPVSIIFSEKCSKTFPGFVGDAIQMFRPAHRAPADAADASPPALAPALPLSVDDADPGLETASVAPRDFDSPTAA